ncbi:MAG TPA: Gldg family protein [Myxococcota bacterium]|nr:Gldg family protein [Myxococcota bacterium]
MSPIMTVARKELRALFHSQVALLFLGVFELATLFAFFTMSRFFARNIADVRPLFEWLPILLVFLTAALTMGQWAEERKVGTLEVLLTLPVRTRDLVLGKFIAATALVGVALALTFPLPMMVSMLGDLDWGPVIGGYVAATLLGALYVSIGLYVSSRTDNQLVALIVTLLIGGALYLLGTQQVTSLLDTFWSSVLRLVGTSSRFESIQRGVLDLRDLVYYGGLTALFLVLNTSALELDRVDPGSERGRARTTALSLLGALTFANALAAVVWLTPVTQARVDLTEGGEFSISPVTRQMLADLDEPLFIDGYFSERTHPLLAPLVPQIKDTLEEYRIAGKGRVEVNFADPNADSDLEQEITEQYGIRSVPFQVEDATQQAVVNSYFHLLVRYGDQYEVLQFDDLIEFYANSTGAEVRLKNLEYDLTRTIKKVSQDFTTVEGVMSDLPAQATLTAYVTRATLPEEFKEVPDIIKKIGDELAGKSGGKLVFQEIDPGDDEARKEELFKKYGVRPLAVDLFATQTFYLDLLLTMGEEVQRLSPRGEVKDADLRKGIESALKRLAPGQLTTVGLLTEIPEAPPPNPQIPPQFQPPPPRPDYQVLAQVLGDTYEIENIDATAAQIPDTVDVLVIGKPGAMSDELRFAVDQYLMRGGRVIALAGSNKISVDRTGLSATAQDKGLAEMLETWGVKVIDGFVLDERNAAFPRPVRRPGIPVPFIELAPYPFFPDVRQDGFAKGSPVVAGLVNLTAAWASPLEIKPIEGVTATAVALTSDKSWTYTGTDLNPPTPGAERKAQPIVVAATGTFPSFFTTRPNPTFRGEGGTGDATGRTIKQSLPDARLAVVGSSEMVSDLLLQLASQPGGEVHRGNLQLLQNLIDWSTEDTDLLEIRSAGAFARTLEPMEEADRNMYMYGQYFLALILTLGVGMVGRFGRSGVKPITV